MRRKFETEVQYLKYRVLKAIAKHEFNGTLTESITDIPKEIIPGPKPTTRCCIYKERAIVSERIKMALGGNKDNPNVIEVIDIACDECPVGGYNVTDSCRGCIAHRCSSACKFGAIYFDRNKKAHIDKEKCRECGACAKVCPYLAIKDSKRPCEISCKVGAIHMDESWTAVIDNNKCIRCGACVSQCPFGAIVDKSYIVNVVKMIKNNDNLFAVVAPSIATQFSYATYGQVITAIKKAGFDTVIEAALGADLVAYHETQELAEKGFLTTSCCPAFVNYVKNEFPGLVGNISSTPSPMAVIGKMIKENDSNAKVVFVGPCTAKKDEMLREEVKPYIDAVLTFEELQSLFGAFSIELQSLEETVLDDASYFGRIFARSGGVTEAVRQSIKEQNLDCNFNPIACDGIENLKILLLKANKKLLPNNFIEGMACTGGCIGGPCSLSHEAKDRMTVDKFSQTATKKEILKAVNEVNIKE